MKRIKLTEVVAWLQQRFEALLSERYFKDKLSLSLLIPTIMLNIITIIIMFVRLRPTDFPVPIKYSSLTGFDTLGPWYSVYRIGLFAGGVTLVNTALAVTSFKASRITSFLLGAGSFVVALFCLIIGAAFTVTV